MAGAAEAAAALLFVAVLVFVSYLSSLPFLPLVLLTRDAFKTYWTVSELWVCLICSPKRLEEWEGGRNRHILMNSRRAARYFVFSRKGRSEFTD